MSTERKSIPENELENIVGGYMQFDQPTKTLTYYHKDGSVTTHDILKFKAAWTANNEMHTEGIPEDEILERLIEAGYVAG